LSKRKLLISFSAALSAVQPRQYGKADFVINKICLAQVHSYFLPVSTAAFNICYSAVCIKTMLAAGGVISW